MRNHMAAGWFYSPQQIVHYLITRPSSLKPPRNKLDNPIRILATVNRHQWLMFFCGFTAWTWDAFDFFTVSLTLTEIAEDFKVPNSDISWGITVTLMLRSVGALIFGTISDRFGRKWPMIACLVLFIILELATGFTNTKPQFLAVRSLYGIAMGGMFGPAAVTALEDLPYEARGILSGLYQQGYAVGYLLAALFYRALVPTTTHGWRSLYWFGAGPPVLIILYRFAMPETNHFGVARAEREANLVADKEAQGASYVAVAGYKAFAREGWKAIKKDWFLLIYMVVLMSGFNACSHGSQDLYPTFLKNQAELDASDVTVVTVVGQIGALIGAMVLGHLSSYCGRRLTMMVACCFGAALIPAYILPRNMSLTAAAFWLQFFVGGVWGPIPVYLIELAPSHLRSLIVGLTYQLGNLASSASSTIESTIGERYPLAPLHGVDRYDYGKVMAIFMGSVWAYQFFWLFWGPEMTEDERAENAEEGALLEKMRSEGVSLKDIGASRVKTRESQMTKVASAIEPEVQHTETADEKIERV